MLMDAKKISALIREKKKKMMDDPEVVQTMPNSEMNAQDVWDMEKKGYIEDMIKPDPKINADETSMNEPDDEEIKRMQDARMARLKSYMDGLDL